MMSLRAPLFALALVCFAPACQREAAPTPTAEAPAPKPAGPCSHAACGEGFFVDVVPPAACKSKEPCPLEVRLEATGEFHINDEYPYKLVADAPAPGVEYHGADPAAPGTFSKKSGEWQKTAEKKGTMKAQLVAASSGSVPFGGTFKLSVCSAAKCALEQPHIAATLAVN